MPTAVTNQGTTFSINDTKLYLPIVTFSSQNNEKLLEKSKGALKEQLTGMYINQKYQQKDQIPI